MSESSAASPWTDARLGNTRIAAGAPFERRRDLLDELLHDRRLGEILGDLAARRQIARHRGGDQPFGDAANLLGFRRGRFDASRV